MIETVETARERSGGYSNVVFIPSAYWLNRGARIYVPAAPFKEVAA